MAKPKVAPKDRPAKGRGNKAAVERPRSSKSGTKGTKKVAAKKAPPNKAAPKKTPAKKAPAKSVETAPAVERSTANAAAGAAKAGGSAWRLDGVSQATRDLAAAAADKAGVSVGAWVDSALAEAANRFINSGSAASGSAADLLPSIGELSQKLDILRHAIGNEDSPVAKLASQLKGSADEIAMTLGQRFKTAAEKAPPLDEVTARLKQSVRFAREHAALDDVASKWREHVDTSKWREHVRQARQVAGGVIGEVKGKAEGAIEDLWNRQNRETESPEQKDERRDGTG